MTEARDRIQWRRVATASLGCVLALTAPTRRAHAEPVPRIPAQSQSDAPGAASASDPLLTPPPPAPREVKSWDDALALLRASSPDYITGYESVVRAAAQSRIALGAALPTLNGQGSYVHQFFTESIPFAGTVLVVPPVDTFAATATAQWNISPRAIYAVGTADKNIAVAKLSFEDRRRVIATAVVGAMLATLATSRVAEADIGAGPGAVGRGEKSPDGTTSGRYEAGMGRGRARTGDQGARMVLDGETARVELAGILIEIQELRRQRMTRGVDRTAS